MTDVLAETAATSAAPRWYAVTAVVALLWNLMGVAAFLAQLTMDLSTLPADQRAFHEATPLWAKLAFAVAVFGGTLGCVALVLRRSWALPMLLICLAGIVVQIGHSLFLGDGLEVFGPEGLVLPALTFLIAVALVFLAKHASRSGWTR